MSGPEVAPLAGLRVVEFAEGIAAPYGAEILAHLGAEVIKVERPEGDWLRHTAHASFEVVNKNKRAVCLDAKSPAGTDALWRLIEGAHVLVTNYRPQALERLGITPSSVTARAPGVVFARLTAYGSTGRTSRRGGTDTILQAVSGLMDQVGDVDGEPTRIGFPLVDLVAGRDLATGVLAALLGARLQAGRKVHLVEVSLFSSASSLLLEAWQSVLSGGPPLQRTGARNAVHAPGGIYRCAGGSMLALITLRDRDWVALCELFGRDDLLCDERLRTNGGRVALRDDVDAAVEASLSQRDAAAWMPVLTDAGITCGLVGTVATVRDDPELFALVPTTVLSGPAARTANVLGIPIALAGARASAPPAPTLGADTRSVFDEFHLSAAEIDTLLRAQRPGKARP